MTIMSPQFIRTLVENVPAPILWATISQYSEPFFISVLTILWGIFVYRRTRPYWTVPAYITAGLTVSVPVSMALRQIVGQTRPFADGGFPPLVFHEADFGFPSNHAVATAVFTTVFLWFGYRGIGAAVAGLTVLVGASRVLTGLHYPADIMVGWLLGGLIAGVICYYRFAKFSWISGYIRQSPDMNKDH